MVASSQTTLSGHAGSLYVKRWNNEAPRRTVILVHGYGEHIGRYEGVAAMLVGGGAVVWGLDHAGHGHSDGERGLIASLDAAVGEDEDSSLGDFIQDEDNVSPEEAATYELLKEHIDETLELLTPREQKILRMRFGLEDGRSHTLEEVGQEFGVTRERIRQIEAKALTKLRKHKDSKRLKDYIG